jgi:hypothetical protein
MIANSDCRQVKKSGLTLVSRNHQPRRELQCPNRWLLHSRDQCDFSVLVSHDGMSRPHIIYKEAA